MKNQTIIKTMSSSEILQKKPVVYNKAAYQKSIEDMYDEMGFPIDENFDGFLFI